MMNMMKTEKWERITKGAFLVIDNRVSNGPLGRLQSSFTRTAHSAHWLRYARFTGSLTHKPVKQASSGWHITVKVSLKNLGTCVTEAIKLTPKERRRQAADMCLKKEKKKIEKEKAAAEKAFCAISL